MSDDHMALWFDPESVRLHFEAFRSVQETAGYSDELLRAVGECALQDEQMWEAFHDSLDRALNLALAPCLCGAPCDLEGRCTVPDCVASA